MSTTNNEMPSGFLPNRIIHLHPTRLCNLACLHCYSESGPKEKTALDFNDLKRTLLLLKEEGYSQISLSGGEPLTYPHILPLVDFAHGLGYKITMITNGMFPVSKLKEVVMRLDGAAISFDGLAPTHNRLRGKADAFERACTALAHIANEGIPVAAAISLTTEAIPDLPDLAYHMSDIGVKTIQVRPVALAGRAKLMTDIRSYTTADQSRLYLVVLALQEELRDQVRIHCDLAPARNLWQQRNAYSALLATCNDKCIDPEPYWLLSDLINPLVITETGILKPIAYDFSMKYNITTTEGLSRENLVQYKKEKLFPFRDLIGEALVELEKNRGLIDWFDYCTRRSEENSFKLNQVS